jgi:Tfp pilus assembly protein FimV
MKAITARNAVKVAAAACFTLGAGASQAFSVGQPDVESYLSEPLRARIHIALQPGEAPPNYIGLASAEDFARFGVGEQAPTNLTVSSTPSGNGVDVLIESRMPVSEPMFSVLLDVRSGPLRSLRAFTVMLDPQPVGAPAQTQVQAPIQTAAAAVPTAAAPTAVPGSETPAAAAPAASSAPAAAASAARSPAQPAARRHRRGSGIAPAASPAVAAGDVYGPVLPNETLSQIAEKVRVNPNTPLDRVVDALVALNPDATHGRTDFVLAGALLRVPAELAAVPAGYRISAAPSQSQPSTPVQYLQLAYVLRSLRDNPSLAAQPAPTAPDAGAGASQAASQESRQPGQPVAAAGPAPAAAVEDKAGVAAAPAPQPKARRSRPAQQRPEATPPAVAASRPRQQPLVYGATPLHGLMLFTAIVAALAAALFAWARRRERANLAAQPPLVPALVEDEATRTPKSRPTLAAVAPVAAVRADIAPDERVILLKQAYAARGKRFRDIRHA